MVGLGIALGLVTALLKGLDTMMNKSFMGEISALEHSIYRIIFVIPCLGVAALINWRFERECVDLLLIYGLLEAVNILGHQFAIKTLNPIHAEIMSKSKSLLTYVISVILVVESLSVPGIVGIILFFAGMLLTIDFRALNPGKFTDWKGYLYEMSSVVARTVKPFILRDMLLRQMISNEALAFVSMLIAFFIIYAVFRPKHNFKKINAKKYFGLSLIVGSSMITSGYAVLLAGAVLTSMLENFSVFFVIILMIVMYKKNVKIPVWIGGLLTIIGTCLCAL